MGHVSLTICHGPVFGGNVLDFDLPLDLSIPTIAAGDLAVALQSAPAAVTIAFIAYIVGKGSVPNAVKIPDKQANDATQTKTTARTTTSSVKLAPYVTTNYEEAQPTDTFDMDEAYELGVYLQKALLSIFPTKTIVRPHTHIIRTDDSCF